MSEASKFCVYNCSCVSFFNTLLHFFNDVDIVLICNARPFMIHEIMTGLIRMNTQQRAGTPLVCQRITNSPMANQKGSWRPVTG
jgi:hypothetical protein